jgi:hypothetical protein
MKLRITANNSYCWCFIFFFVCHSPLVLGSGSKGKDERGKGRNAYHHNEEVSVVLGHHKHLVGVVNANVGAGLEFKMDPSVKFLFWALFWGLLYKDVKMLIPLGRSLANLVPKALSKWRKVGLRKGRWSGQRLPEPPGQEGTSPPGSTPLPGGGCQRQRSPLCGRSEED